MIGGGASATAVLNALIKMVSGQIGEAPHVVVFEPAGVPGPGVAYGADTEAALLNRPACTMSVDYGDPGHFRRWLARCGEPAARDAQQFVSRASFGRYLAEMFSVCGAELTALGGSVEVVPQLVTGLRRRGAEWAISAGGVERTADHVVLCPGAIPPVDVYGLDGSEGYAPHPYPLQNSLEPARSASSVLVLGSGLTAVDVALELARESAGSRITLASRSGLVPDVRSDSSQSKAVTPLLDRAAALLSQERPTGLVLGDVLGLIDDDLRSKGSSLRESVQPFLARWPADRILRTRLADPSAGALVQGCVNELTPLYGALWRALSPRCKRTFQRRLGRLWGGLRSPLPPVTAHRLLEMVDDGQLRFAAGLRDVAPTPAGFVARWSGSAEQTYEVVVNATGRNTQVALAPGGSLLARLIDDEVVRSHPAGGVDVDSSTQEAINAPGLFVVGDLAGGVHFHTSSMESVASQAHRVAAALTARSHSGWL